MSKSKILIIIIVLTIPISVGFYFYFKIKSDNAFLSESLAIAKIIENESIEAIEQKLENKVSLLYLGKSERPRSRISPSREYFGMETLKEFFEPYKVDGYICFKRNYKDDKNNIHLVFVVASSIDPFDVNVFELLITKTKKGVIISDLFAYSRGAWESKIQSVYLERLYFPKHILPYVSDERKRRLDSLGTKWKYNPSDHFNIRDEMTKINSLIDTGFFELAIEKIKELPSTYKENPDIVELVLFLSSVVSPDSTNRYFFNLLDSTLKVNKSIEFHMIWNYRKAILGRDIASIKSQSAQIKKKVGNDVIFDVDENCFLIAISSLHDEAKRKLDSIVVKNLAVYAIKRKCEQCLSMDNF
jgi:hypothetical protein